MCNLIYVIIQLMFLNLHLDSLAMIHSNLPAQESYFIPIFITEPFFRYTGLFNESSPFAFYLSIAFCFFLSLGKNYIVYKRIALALLILSGSKLSYIFIMLYYSIFSKYKILRVFISIGVAILFYNLVNDFQYIYEMTNGQVASLISRFAGLDIDYKNIGILEMGLEKSSTGDLPLNMYAILLNGFGYSSIFILFFIFIFYRYIENKHKKYFLLPFIIGTLSNGSLLIFQYTLIAYCLVYLHNNPNINE